MEQVRKDELIAVVTTNKEAVGGEIPIFFASTPEEQARVASVLAIVMKAMVHDIGEGVYVIVKH